MVFTLTIDPVGNEATGYCVSEECSEGQILRKMPDYCTLCE